MEDIIKELSPKEKILQYLIKRRDENLWWGWEHIKDETGIEEEEARKIVKELVNEGEAYCSPLYCEEDGKFRGKGYFATEGVK